MTENNYIVMEFTKSNGEKHSVKLSYPKTPVIATDVKAVADFIVANKVFNFADGATITKFEGAMTQTVTEADIKFAG